jgi:nucleoside-diphosphate-sugar epimerase
MRIFVAGGTGAIGRQVIPLLVGAGHEVTVASRSAGRVRDLLAAGARGVVADVFDRDGLAVAVAAAEPEAVVHQLTSLAQGDPVQNALIRREGTRNLVDAALKAGARVFLAQSISWAYEPGEDPAVEATPLDLAAPEPRAVSVGGVAALEDTVAGAGFERHVILRFGTFYGPGTWYAPGAAMAERVTAGTLPANDGIASFVHVRDAAEATVLALDDGWPSGPVNIVDDEPAPASAWVPWFARALGLPAPEPVPGRAVWERGADNTLARSLGWQPRYPSWRAGFAALTA